MPPRIALINEEVSVGSSSSCCSFDESTCSQEDLKTTFSTRRVRFARDDENIVYKVEPFSSVEKVRCYMQKEDFKRCESDCRSSVRRYWVMEKAGGLDLEDDDQFCMRGLEEFVDEMQAMIHEDEERQTRGDVKDIHNEAVLKECRKQLKKGKDGLDAFKIHLASTRLSAVSQVTARQVAREDELEARALHLSASGKEAIHFQEYKRARHMMKPTFGCRRMSC